LSHSGIPRALPLLLLLLLFAVALDRQLAADLFARYPQPDSHRDQLHFLASDGSALGALETNQISSLAQTV
jgi:hypothetical protein